jgi:ferric enterobactin receptor
LNDFFGRKERVFFWGKNPHMTPLLRKWLSIIVLVSVSFDLHAQGRLTGRLLDKQAQPIGFATVTMVDLYTRAAVKIGQTDSSGQFVVDEVPYGLFVCKISHAGYQSLIKDSIVLTRENNFVNLGDLVAIRADDVLEEVTVSARTPTIRNSSDKKVFAVNQSLVSVGGSAEDLIQNIPTLQVDANGNVSLRGATDLQVLVDGKRSLIGGGTVSGILESIPASAIDRVEIITNPSSKYDATGQALINIVLKKNHLSGSNASAAVTGGTRDNYNAAASISDAPNRVNLYGNYSYQHQNKYSNGYQNMTYLTSPDSIYYSYETFPSVTISDVHSVNGGIDLTMSDKDALSLSGLYNTYTKNRSEWLTVNNLTAANLPGFLSTRHNTTTGDGNNYELTLDYTHKFKPQKELSLDLDYSPGTSNQQQVYTSYINNLNGVASDSTSVLKDGKSSVTRNYNIQLDYTTPVGKTGKLETGYRSQIHTEDNGESDFTLDKTSSEYDPDYSLINTFKSTTQVHAVYVNYRRQFNTVSVQLGIRGELGRFSGHIYSFDSTGNPVTTPIAVNTKGLYPDLLLLDRLAHGQQIQLSYSRRVTRPLPSELNPFWDVSDPVNYDEGNPQLLPESINSVELTYSGGSSKASFSTGVYYTQVNDVIKHVQTVPVNGVTFTVAENLKRSINTGLELIGNFHLIKSWDFTANVNLYERINTGDSAFGISATQGLSWNLNVTNNFTLIRHLTLQIRTDYKAADLIFQDRYRPTWGVDAGARYEFLHGKASLALNGRDIFNTRRWTFLRESDALSLNFQRVTYSARASLTFTYHFGKSSTGGSGGRRKTEVDQDIRIENR